MYNQNKILDIYNKISDNQLTKQELSKLISKIYLIINKINLDEIELIEIIDVLKEIDKVDKLDKVTPEVIDLIIRITKNEKINLEGTLYFPIILKHVIIPYNLNVCDKEYNLMVYLSEFEILIELISKMLNKKDLMILDQYNHELKEITIKYKEAFAIYKKYATKDIMLSILLSHFASILYFHLDEFEKGYDLIVDLLMAIVNNYSHFVRYCTSLGIYENLTLVSKDLKNIEKEYIISNDMLKYIYTNKKEKINKKEEIKRKCK